MEGYFAIVDYKEEKAFIKHIVYSGTEREAINRLYSQNDFSGPWDTEKEAEDDLDRLVTHSDFPVMRV